MTKETKQSVIDALREYIGEIKSLMQKIELDSPASNDYQTLEDLLVRTEYVTNEEVHSALAEGGFSSWKHLTEVRSRDGVSRIAASIGTLKGIVRFVTEELEEQRQRMIKESKIGNQE